MASTHEQIVEKIQTDWSVQNRGRVFKNHSGGAWRGRVTEELFITDKKNNRKRIIHLYDANFIKYGLRSKSQTLLDLMGFEIIDNVAVFCGIEAKTLKHKKLEKGQIDALNMIKNFNGRAYVARQIESDKIEYEMEVF